MALLYINNKFGKVVKKKSSTKPWVQSPEPRGWGRWQERAKNTPQSPGTNQTKNVNDLYNENDKTSSPIKETKENTYTNRKMSSSLIGKIPISKAIIIEIDKKQF